MNQIFKSLGGRALVTALAIGGFSVPAQANSDLFCSADAHVFGHEKVHVAGKGIIHASDGLPAVVRSNKKIYVNGRSMIDGDAISGGKLKISKNAVVTGLQIAKSSDRIVLDPVHDLVATYEFNNSNHLVPMTDSGAVALKGTELKLTGDDALTLVGGDYYFSSAKVSGGATLRLDGDVRIYMPKGKFKLTGKALTALGTEASSLTIIMAGKGKVKVTGGSNLHAAVYAPNAKIYVTGHGDAWGSMLGKKVKVAGGAELHPHDVCLDGPPPIEPEPGPELEPEPEPEPEPDPDPGDGVGCTVDGVSGLPAWYCF